MIDGGTDLTVFPDLSFNQTVTGRRNRAEALARRLMTPPGGLFYSDDYGLDIREYLNDDAPGYVWQERGRLINYQCERDPYITNCDATITPPTPRTDTFTVALLLEDETGSAFSLELSVDKFLVEVKNVISATAGR